MVVWFVSHFLARTPVSLPGCVGVSFWRNVPGSLSTPSHSAAGDVITLWHWPSFFPYLFSPPSLLQAPVLKKELFLCFGVVHRFGGVFCKNLCSLSVLLANRCWKAGGHKGSSQPRQQVKEHSKSPHIVYNLMGALLSSILHVINAREEINEKLSMKSCLICRAVESCFFWRALVILTSPLVE